MNEIAARNAKASEYAGLASALHGAGQNEQHGRPGNQEQTEHHRDESAQCSEVKHVVSWLRMIRRRRAGPSRRCCVDSVRTASSRCPIRRRLTPELAERLYSD